MKLQEINAIIEETISNEIKSRILQEQDDNIHFMDSVQSLESIAPLADKITNIEHIGENGIGTLITIQNIGKEDFMKCCNTSNIDDIEAQFHKNISREILNKIPAKNFDVEVHIDYNDSQDNLQMQIKIIPSEELGSEITEDMENTNKNEFLECLLRAKENNEETFNVQGQDYNVNEYYSMLEEELDGVCDECNKTQMDEREDGVCECGRTLSPMEEMCECGKMNPYFVTQEEAEPCEGCDEEQMDEQEFTPASKDTGKGKYGTEENKMTNVFKEQEEDPGQAYFNKVMSKVKGQEAVESELSGINKPNEYGHSDQEAEGLMETKNKKVVRLTEEKFRQLINKIVAEAIKPKVVGETPKVTAKTKPYKDAKKSEMKETGIVDGSAKTIPGLQAVKSAHEGDAEESKEYLSSVDKKMKDYLNFEGNDNPEFPQQIGGEKVAHRNTTEGEEYIETYRGGKPTDLGYDTPPSKDFKDRVKKALSGDSTMGNKQDGDTANVIPSKVGEKALKAIKTKRETVKKDPMYVKDPQPTSNVESSKKAMGADMRFVAAEDKEKQKVIEEEIQRMKEISSYGKKTQ